MTYRISVDTGGTFTDVVIVDAEGTLHIGKALTTYQRAFDGVSQAVGQVSERLGLSVSDLLSQTTHFAYGTTRSTNAIVEAKTGKTAFFTTHGFPDTLLLREGGRLGGAFSPKEFSAPFVPRYLTFEIEERIDSDGTVFRSLNEQSVVQALEQCRNHGVQAIGVSLMWSTVNAAHELRVGELIAEHLPSVPFTLSHELNPILREYRRASSTVIDASLKPLMQDFLGELAADLQGAGFGGIFLLSTSFGGSWPVPRMIQQPIFSVGSGPSMAPIAALQAGVHTLNDPKPNVLVCDTGGTTFDVGLISDGAIHYSSDTWLGQKWTGHITGTKSVDVRSIGAGGGSIISIDKGGLVRVGPESAGADPGPACYQRGGTQATVTDAALVLGYFDPAGFVGGTLALSEDAARAALSSIADRLDVSLEQAARGALTIATHNIVSAIREMTISQGIDPRDLSIVAGGGASGVNIVQIARELGVNQVVLPKTAGALSAAGALNADIISDFSVSAFATSRDFELDQVNQALLTAHTQADIFIDEVSSLQPVSVEKTLTVDARYPGQVWELEIPVPQTTFSSPEQIEGLVEEFHAQHQKVFQVNDPSQPIECLVWKLRVTAELEKPSLRSEVAAHEIPAPRQTRLVHFAEETCAATPVFDGDELAAGNVIAGPAIILEATTTLVVDPGAVVTVAPNGDYVVATGITANGAVGSVEKEAVA